MNEPEDLFAGIVEINRMPKSFFMYMMYKTEGTFYAMAVRELENGDYEYRTVHTCYDPDMEIGVERACNNFNNEDLSKSLE